MHPHPAPALTPRSVGWPLTALLAALALPAQAQAPAGSAADIEQARQTMARLIGQLADQGVLTKDRAEGLIKEVASEPAAAARPATPTAAAKPAPGTVRVGYVPQFVRDEIKQELRAELVALATRDGWAGPGAVPPWVRTLQVDGDLRLRGQADRFADGNAPAVSVSETNRLRATTLANTTEDRQRLRVRARLGVTADIDPNWSAGVRLSTGSSTDPLSSNQTLGTYGNRFTAAFDRAYVRWRSGDQFNAVAGRFGNPWYGTDLVWANDLGFDGAAVQWTPSLPGGGRAFVTAAVLPVQEVELSSADKWLVGAQLGAEHPRLFGRVGAKIGLGYYNYSKTVGQLSPAGSTRNEFTAPAFAQKGNTYYNISSDASRPLLGLAADYKLVNVTGSLSVPLSGDQRVTLSGDYVRNIGFDRKAVAARAGFDVQPQVSAWQLRVALGAASIARFGDWQVFAGYKRVERDAVPDAFTDSDFRLGGTDAKGWLLGGSFGLGKDTAFNVRVLSADSISGPPLGVDVVQFDLMVRF